MAYYSPLAKVQYDLKRGMKMKAAMRLRNLINIYPEEIQLRGDLAQIYYEAGFLDAAGLFWMLDEAVESYKKECIKLYEASVNNSPVQILKDIKFRGDRIALPVHAQEKLAALEVRKREIEEHTREYARKNNILEPPEPTSLKDKIKNKIKYMLTALLVLLVASVILSGLSAVFGFIKRVIVEW